MGSDYSFYVKSIATYAPTFLEHNNSVLAIAWQVSHKTESVKFLSKLVAAKITSQNKIVTFGRLSDAEPKWL